MIIKCHYCEAKMFEATSEDELRALKHIGSDHFVCTECSIRRATKTYFEAPNRRILTREKDQTSAVANQ